MSNSHHQGQQKNHSGQQGQQGKQKIHEHHSKQAVNAPFDPVVTVARATFE
jgi:hypothetical protein